MEQELINEPHPNKLKQIHKLKQNKIICGPTLFIVSTLMIALSVGIGYGLSYLIYYKDNEGSQST